MEIDGNIWKPPKYISFVYLCHCSFTCGWWCCGQYGTCVYVLQAKGSIDRICGDKLMLSFFLLK